MSKNLLFSSESVNEVHLDKLCDQVSDANDEYLTNSGEFYSTG